METLFDFFADLSAAARGAIDEVFGQGLDPQNKAAAGAAYDPVTEADRQVERALRSMIGARFPLDGIVGEEFGAERADARRIWSLDPIDGTRALVCGLPSWTVLVGLVEDGRPIAGMIDAPRLGEMVVGDGAQTLLLPSPLWGGRGGGRPGSAGRKESLLASVAARAPTLPSPQGGGRLLSTSGIATLAEARLSTTDPYLLDADAAPRFDRLRQAARLTRYGLDGYAYARIALGTIDLVAETGLKPHDWQALVPVVRGAGGVIGNWQGGDDLSAGDVLAAASQPLFDEAVALLAG